ncbi:MAG TPA: HEAT repeat domain-containing protein [Candidatus Wallbacteria bacterium]|mgnify:CR=1 FL=1|nr:HEAT repeat domain-containing protein [Candidatus Wallbacteria bacterium]
MDIEVEVLVEECIEAIKAKEVDKLDYVVLKLKEIGPPAYILLCLSIKQANEFESMYLMNAVIAIGWDIVPYLLRLLPDLSGVTKSYVISALGEMKNPEAVDQVKLAFEDSDAQVRLSVLQAIACYYSDKAFAGTFDGVLLKALNDGDIDVRSYATGILGDSKSELALADLITMTSDEEPSVRAAAARAIGKQRDAKGCECLAGLLNDPMAFVISAACLALAEIGENRFIPQIGEMLMHKSELVRASAVKALGRMRSQTSITLLESCLKDENDQVRELASRVIKFLNEKRGE